MKIILLRHLPGSGASTLAHDIASDPDKNFMVIETDQFFENVTTGVYEFDHSKLGQAHSWCQALTEHVMYNSSMNVIIANTFSQIWEMEPYFFFAKKYGYTVEIRTIVGDFPGGKWEGKEEERQALRARMAERWEDRTTGVCEFVP